MDDPRLVWRIRHPDGRLVPFFTEAGARLAAGLAGSRDARGPRAVVEHDDGDGWHECPPLPVVPTELRPDPGIAQLAGLRRLYALRAAHDATADEYAERWRAALSRGRDGTDPDGE